MRSDRKDEIPHDWMTVLCKYNPAGNVQGQKPY
jgi:hypothetical protein